MKVILVVDYKDHTISLKERSCVTSNAVSETEIVGHGQTKQEAITNTLKALSYVESFVKEAKEKLNNL